MVYCIGSPKVCRVPARDLWTHMLTKYCHFLPFFKLLKKDAVWIMGFVGMASFVSYRNFLFWPIRMKYDLFFCQDACLGTQQISKHNFCKLNKWNDVSDIQGPSLIAVPSTAALSCSKSSSDSMSCANCGTQDSDK
jgi:hypothetical protein